MSNENKKRLHKLKVGSEIAVYWNDYKSHFACWVIGKSSTNSILFQLKYEDGTIEWRDMSKAKFRWQDPLDEELYLDSDEDDNDDNEDEEINEEELKEGDGSDDSFDEDKGNRNKSKSKGSIFAATKRRRGKHCLRQKNKNIGYWSDDEDISDDDDDDDDDDYSFGGEISDSDDVSDTGSIIGKHKKLSRSLKRTKINQVDGEVDGMREDNENPKKEKDLDTTEENPSEETSVEADKSDALDDEIMIQVTKKACKDDGGNETVTMKDVNQKEFRQIPMKPTDSIVAGSKSEEKDGHTKKNAEEKARCDVLSKEVEDCNEKSYDIVSLVESEEKPKTAKKSARKASNSMKCVSGKNNASVSTQIQKGLSNKEIKKQLCNKQITKQTALLNIMVNHHMVGATQLPLETIFKDLGFKSKNKAIEIAWKEVRENGFVEEVKNQSSSGSKKLFRLTPEGIDLRAPDDYKYQLANPPQTTQELHGRIRENPNEYFVQIFDLLLNNGSMSTKEIAGECGVSPGSHKFFYGFKTHKTFGYVVKDPHKAKTNWILCPERAFLK